MATCDSTATLHTLVLPRELDDLTGLIETDLQAIVSMVTQKADERLFLTRKEKRELRQQLWNRLVETIHQTVAPLTAESR